MKAKRKDRGRKMESSLDTTQRQHDYFRLGLLHDSNSLIDPNLQMLFAKFADEAKKFSQDIEQLIKFENKFDSHEFMKINVYLARTIFSKWSIEILTVLYNLRLAGYSDLKNRVGRITSRILSQKLKHLEKAKLIQRSVIDTRPPTVRYSLTEKGFNIARIAEPVFLYAAATEELYRRPTFLLDKK
jgi:DNA-binding HxlR family transcriptional regulator